MNKPVFKACPMCQKVWATRNIFLDDPELLFDGYQPDFGILDDGHFYFTHDTEECGSTMTLEVNTFLSLLSDKNNNINSSLSTKPSNSDPACKIYSRNSSAYQKSFILEVCQLLTSHFDNRIVAFRQ